MEEKNKKREQAENTAQPLLKIRNLSFTYKEATSPVLENISLDLFQNEIVAVLGASGAGKTTLFHLIAGIYEPELGSIMVGGSTNYKGQVSYMLQKDLLLEHKTVLDNIILPLIIAGEKKKAARARGKSLLLQFGMQEWEGAYPSQLSGGMRQRVALLRTSLFGKDLVLLDEAFSSVDAITKTSLHHWYNNFRKEMKLSTLLITHDIDEALRLSDRIYLLKGQPASFVSHIDLHSVKKADEMQLYSLRAKILDLLA